MNKNIIYAQLNIIILLLMDVIRVKPGHTDITTIAVFIVSIFVILMTIIKGGK